MVNKQLNEERFYIEGYHMHCLNLQICLLITTAWLVVIHVGLWYNALFRDIYEIGYICLDTDYTQLACVC